MAQTTKVRNNLAVARMRKRLSRRRVSRLIGSSIHAVTAYEQGRCCPRLPVALKFELLYGEPLIYLWPNLFLDALKELQQPDQEVIYAE
jgi:DNA-binding XRE family transcriptional regulator